MTEINKHLKGRIYELADLIGKIVFDNCGGYIDSEDMDKINDYTSKIKKLTKDEEED